MDNFEIPCKDLAGGILNVEWNDEGKEDLCISIVMDGVDNFVTVGAKELHDKIKELVDEPN